MPNENDPHRFDADIARAVDGGWYFDAQERHIAEGLRAVGLLTSDEQVRAFLIAVAQSEHAISEIRRENMRKQIEQRAALPWWKRWLT